MFRLQSLPLMVFLSPLAMADSAQLPVREVTVFKDGHAMIYRHGPVATSDSGNVLLTDLPRPVMGTFWPFSDDPQAKLDSVSVGSREAKTEVVPAKNFQEFIRVNVGRTIRFVWGQRPIEGRIRQVLKEDAMVLIETKAGFQMLPISSLRDVVFPEPPATELSRTSERTTLELELNWNGAHKDTASVGLMYLQKGIRWIPSYKIGLGEDGRASVHLQATLINDLIDLKDTTVQLVVGVPSFAFKTVNDPIGGPSTDPTNEQQQLSSYFRPNSQSASAFSNAITTQVRMGDHRGARVAEPAGQSASDPLDPEQGNPGEQHVFALEDVTLRKGDRQVVTIGRWEIPYEEIHKLEIDSLPPSEFLQNHGGQENAQLIARLSAPKVKRYLRLRNTTEAPLTTAPALVVDAVENRVLAQSMMTYAAIGSRVDVEVTTAVDIQVSRADRESGRTPNALQHNGNDFYRVDLDSSVSLTNYRSEPLTVEVERRVLGAVRDTTSDGEVTTPLFHERFRYHPRWYAYYGWPYWWNYLNTVRTVHWTLELPPGQTETVSIDWYYYWR